MYDATFEPETNALVIRIKGSFSFEYTPEFKRQIKEAIGSMQYKKFIADLSGLTYIDSSGLGSLFHMKNSIDKIGGEMLIRSIPERIIEVFKSSGFYNVFNII
ncbi:MAG: STAS domain-containing protein [Spirochaetota bacterium]